MKPQRLVWQIFPASALTLLIAIVAVCWYVAAALQEFHLQEKEDDLEARANLIGTRVKEYLREDQMVGLREYCIRAGRSSGTRITVIGAEGKVLADSVENPEVMDNHRHRLEIAEAFAGATGRSRRYSPTLRENFVYVAIRWRIRPCNLQTADHVSMLSSGLPSPSPRWTKRWNGSGCVFSMAPSQFCWWLAWRP